MKWGWGAQRLCDLVNGVLYYGWVPRHRLQRMLYSETNGSGITIAAAETTLITLSASDTIKNGDYLFIHTEAHVVKGATAGYTHIYLGETDLAGNILFSGDQLYSHVHYAVLDANDSRIVNSFALARCEGNTVAGIRIWGTSAGSDSTIAISALRTTLWVIRGELE